MKILFEYGDAVTLAESKIGEDEFVRKRYVFYSYLKTPFSVKGKNGVIVTCDCVVYNPELNMLQPAVSASLRIKK